MKLIVMGATGFCATEIIHQALTYPQITTVVAVARTPINPSPSTPNPNKLRCIVVPDYLTYPDEARREFTGADACIWTVSITPQKSRMHEWDNVRRVCLDSTLVGFEAMVAAGPAQSFRFLYMSGATAERDQTKTPSYMPRYSLLRGETETKVLEFAASHNVQVAIAKPGLLFRPGSFFPRIASFIAPSMGVGHVDVVATAILRHIIGDFKQQTLMPEDMVRIANDQSSPLTQQ